MRFVLTKNLENGMTLARPLFTPDGRILLNSGVQFEASYIERLRILGIPGVYIDDAEIGELVYPEMVSQRTRTEATQAVKSVFDSIRIGMTFTLDEVKHSVKSIIDEVISNANIVASLSDVRSYDSYTFAHSVNVCVLSVMLASKMQLNEKDVYEVALGAMLHDIGKIKVPQEIIQKPGPLTTAEMEIMEKHTSDGWQLLCGHPDVPLMSAHVAYQHHERPSGTGYPRQLKEKEIILAAKIVGIADAYDAMTSERVYRRGMLPYDALQLIKRLSGIQFDSALVELLCQQVAKYPVGSMVRLNSEEMGIVVDVNQGDHSRPVVRLLYDATGKRLPNFHELDLAKEINCFITEVLM